MRAMQGGAQRPDAEQVAAVFAAAGISNAPASAWRPVGREDRPFDIGPTEGVSALPELSPEMQKKFGGFS